MTRIGIACLGRPIAERTLSRLRSIRTVLRTALQSIDIAIVHSTDPIWTADAELMIIWVDDPSQLDFGPTSFDRLTLLLSNDTFRQGSFADLEGCSRIRSFAIRRQFDRHDMELLPWLVARMLTSSSHHIEFTQSFKFPLSFRPNMRLPRAELVRRMADECPQWEIGEKPGQPDRDAVELKRTFKFPTFQNAIDFMTQIAPAFDLMDHHPTWTNAYNRLIVRVCTWVAPKQSVTDKDLLLVRYVDHWWSNDKAAR